MYEPKTVSQSVGNDKVRPLKLFQRFQNQNKLIRKTQKDFFPFSTLELKFGKQIDGETFVAWAKPSILNNWSFLLLLLPSLPFLLHLFPVVPHSRLTRILNSKIASFWILTYFWQIRHTSITRTYILIDTWSPSLLQLIYVIKIILLLFFFSVDYYHA